MSLSAWLRDYVYIPLGGSRVSTARTYGNLWAVFVLCGLWHGASWTYVMWGAHHGLFLVLERAGLGRALARLPRPLSHCYTLLAVFLGWVWFRAKDFDRAGSIFAGLAGANGLGTLSVQTHAALTPVIGVALVIAGVLGLWRWQRPQHLALRLAGVGVLGFGDNAFVLALLALCIVIAWSSRYSPFLYYRF